MVRDKIITRRYLIPDNVLIVSIYLIVVVMLAVSVYARLRCVECSETRLFLDYKMFYMGGIAAISVLGIFLSDRRIDG